MQNKYIILVVGLILVVAVFGFMKMSKTSTTSTVEQDTTSEVVTAPPLDTSDTQMADDGDTSDPEGEAMESPIITVEGANFTFDPNTITVKKGEKVKILFKNIEGFHDLVIDELGVKTAQLQANGEEMVEFTPMEAGEFEFYCSVGKHREMGMKGTLIVE